MFKLTRKPRTTFDLVDQAMDEVFGGNNTLQPERWFSTIETINVARHPISASIQKDNSIRIEFDVPGSSKDDLEISFDEKTKLLKVATKIEKKQDSLYEIRSMSYSYLLEGYDLNTLKAECDKGVLTITIKQGEPPKDTKRFFSIR
jgi:HSP20 family molecular chaperone IbpA